MALKFNCKHCGVELVPKFLKVGEEMKCSACGKTSTIPDNAKVYGDAGDVSDPQKKEKIMATKKCPFCGEEIKVNAVKCKYCGEFLTKEAKKEHHKGNQSALITTLVVLAIIALILIITGV